MPSPASGVPVTRTGGSAGVMRAVEIAPDGSWVFTDKRTAKVERGQLSAGQRQELTRLTADPALRLEARATPAPGVCNDGFIFTLAVGEMSMRYEQCGGPTRRPVTDQVLALVSAATPL